MECVNSAHTNHSTNSFCSCIEYCRFAFFPHVENEIIHTQNKIIHTQNYSPPKKKSASLLCFEEYHFFLVIIVFQEIIYKFKN